MLFRSSLLVSSLVVLFFCCAGILQREQEQSVVYGSVDAGKNISSHDKFLELVRDTCTHPLCLFDVLGVQVLCSGVIRALHHICDKCDSSLMCCGELGC